MPIGNAPNYQANGQGVNEIYGANGEHFIWTYSASDILNGNLVVLDYSPAVNFPAVATPATDSAGVTKIGIVNNVMLTGSAPTATYEGIKAGTWGWVQVGGYCPLLLNANTASLTATQFFKAVNGQTYPAADASLSAKSIGVVKTTSALAAGTDVFLFDKIVTV